MEHFEVPPLRDAAGILHQPARKTNIRTQENKDTTEVVPLWCLEYEKALFQRPFEKPFNGRNRLRLQRPDLAELQRS